MSYLKLFQEKMKKRNISEGAIDLFSIYYNLLSTGIQGVIKESEIRPLPFGSLQNYCDLVEISNSQANLLVKKSAILKLNGGLGTSMGLSEPKSFIDVKKGLRFIDIAANQIKIIQESTGYKIPFILMNSDATNDKSEEFINSRKDILNRNIPTSFIHNSNPRVRCDNLKPFTSINDNEEWNPAGHGDLYISLFSTGIIDKLTENGIEYLFISNIDNLGATFDLKMLNHFANSDAPFMMEVVRRREMDKKGGHLAKDLDGKLILRERAQADKNDLSSFEDINKYSYFNSNSIWINIPKLMEQFNKEKTIKLPFIANRKNINGTDVFQVETAMGSAISLFKNATAIEVPQSRFIPVKKTDDLLLLRSDRFFINDKSEIKECENITKSVMVKLDPTYYGNYADFENLIKKTPSLKTCKSLSIYGKVEFNKNTEISGNVTINGKSTLTSLPNTIIKDKDIEL